MNTNKDFCLNCESPLSPEDKYCPNCGLETTYRNLSLRFLIKSFFEAFLNFDVKMFHSLRDIWIPNKITKTFLQGKREFHIHPFRFYFICLILFFTLFSLTTKHSDFFPTGLQDKLSKYELYLEFDSLSHDYADSCEIGVIDSIKHKMYRGSKKLDRDTFLNMKFFGTDFSDYGISTYDAMQLEEDKLFEKYEIENKYDRYFVSQVRRVIKTPTTALKFAIGNMIWGLILLTIVMGLVLKLLYIRHDSYYIEHLLHIVNFHCLILLVYSFVLILKMIVPENYEMDSLIFFGLVAAILYLIVSLYRYYRQNVFVTLLKTLFLGISYWLMLIVIIIIISLISFIMF